jgi:hypothetical protein
VTAFSFFCDAKQGERLGFCLEAQVTQTFGLLLQKAAGRDVRTSQGVIFGVRPNCLRISLFF